MIVILQADLTFLCAYNLVYNFSYLSCLQLVQITVFSLINFLWIEKVLLFTFYLSSKKRLYVQEIPWLLSLLKVSFVALDALYH